MLYGPSLKAGWTRLLFCLRTVNIDEVPNVFVLSRCFCVLGFVGLCLRHWYHLVIVFGLVISHASFC